MKTNRIIPTRTAEPERVMPQATDAEKVILQEITLNQAAMSTVENILSPSDFYRPKNQVIYSACLRLHARQEMIDLVSLAEELKRMEQLESIGGIPELAELMMIRMPCLNRISEKHIGNGDFSSEEFIYLDESAGAIRPAKIFFADNYTIRHLSSIKKEARRLKRKGQLQFLIIDYLGLIKTGLNFSLRVQEIAYITGELKALAKELDIAVLLLSQLSRPHKAAQGKIPVMEDLRESGDIEQDADIIFLLHKPDYYDPQASDKEGFPWKNRGMLIRAKHREGERNVCFEFAHDNRYKKISDYRQHRESETVCEAVVELPEQPISSSQQLFLSFNRLSDGKTSTDHSGDLPTSGRTD